MRMVLALAVVGLLGEAAQAETVAVVDLQGSSPEHGIVTELRNKAVVAGLTTVADGEIRDALTGAEQTTPTPPPNESLERAAAAFGRLDIETTREELGLAEGALLSSARSPDTVEGLAEVELLRGQLALSTGDTSAASSAFALVRSLRPTLSGLDPARYPPKVQEAYAAASERASVSLRVESPVKKARVFLDGIDRGETPLSLEVSVGAHYLWLEHLDHRMVARRIAVVADTPAIVEMVRRPREDRIRRRRSEIAGGHNVIEMCEQLAELVGVENLLIVDRSAATPMIAWFERQEPSELRWQKVTAIDTRFATLKTAASPGVVVAATESPSWYRGRWVIPVSVATGLVLAATVVWALDPSFGGGDAQNSTGIRFGDAWSVE